MTFHLLTATQAAERAGITRRTLTRWIASGRIAPTVQLPGRTGAMLFHPDDVDAATTTEAAS
jgi:excisionase family DNA binding protein